VYKKKVEGAFIHSKRKWLEEGEQNSHYFFSLERRNFVSNTINKLNIDGVTTDDHTVISQYCSEFFNNLYTSSYSQVTADAFLNSLQIKPIEKHERESCCKLNPLRNMKGNLVINLLQYLNCWKQLVI